MSLHPLLTQTAGSLVAILALAGLAWWLKLGGTPALCNEATLRSAAGEIADGFEVAEFCVSDDHSAALARDVSGQIVLIRRHGNRFAGRILGTDATARTNGAVLEVDCGERRFGVAQLTLDDPSAWEDAINRLKEARHA